ncbi:MAG: carboxypeptidase-like regulatory domain-containing protein [Planctomycetota bacterium]
MASPGWLSVVAAVLPAVAATQDPAPGRTGSISGVVLDAARAPLAGVRVTTMTNDEVGVVGGWSGPAPAVTDATTVTDTGGRYTLHSLRPSLYQLRFERVGHATRYWLGHQVRRSSSLQIPPLRYERGRAVRGTVVLDGTPVLGARVLLGPIPREWSELYFRGERVESDESGRFRTTWRFPPGRYMLMAWRPHRNQLRSVAEQLWSRQTIEVTADAALPPIELDLSERPLYPVPKRRSAEETRNEPPVGPPEPYREPEMCDPNTHTPYKW